jgi:pilus assembly protein CpaE
MQQIPMIGDTTPAGGVLVAIVESDAAWRAEIVGELGRFSVAMFPSVEALEDQLGPDEPAVVVLGPSAADAVGMSAVERLTRLRSGVGTVLVVDTLSTEVLQQSLRAGVRDVLASPIEPGHLAAAVERVAATISASAVASAARHSYAPIGTLGDPDVEPGRVITVFSTKGGAGKSVIAVNLAVALAKKATRPVVLVDADLQFGDIAVMLKLAPQNTIVDAVNANDRLDTSFIESLLATHLPSGVKVLPAPLEPAFADQIGSSQMLRVLDALRAYASIIVVDTPAYFNDVVLGLIEHSDDVVLVAGMDIPNIKNVKIGLQTLRLLNIPLHKLKLVLNRANSKVKLDVGEVEKTLGIKADCLIPSDVVVPQSVNKGVAVVLDAPRSGVTKAIEELAAMFATSDVPQKSRRR